MTFASFFLGYYHLCYQSFLFSVLTHAFFVRVLNFSFIQGAMTDEVKVFLCLMLKYIPVYIYPCHVYAYITFVNLQLYFCLILPLLYYLHVY